MVDRWRLDPFSYFDGMSILIEPQIADAAYMQAVIDKIYED